MLFESKDYVDYCVRAAKLIADNKEYISDLDAATGDGDHWANMNMGFQKIVDSAEELKSLSYAELFKKLGMIMMSTIGGSSGALYGSGYIGAAKAIGARTNLDIRALNDVLAAMLDGICKRGNSSAGMKTMIDTLYAASEEMKVVVADGVGDKRALERLKEAAERGMESTKDMPAIRGRAYYQADKGIGHLDPGAVTMYYQIKTLAECMMEKC